MPIVACKICQNEFYIKPSHQKLGWGKYCSRNCRAKSQFNGKKVVCYICSKEVYRSNDELNQSKSGKYFCTKKCQTLWRNALYVEDRSSNWKSGKASYRKIMTRRDLLLKCTRCSLDDKRILVIHHKNRNRDDNTISNLICLCLNCHFLVHHDNKINDVLNNDNLK